MATLRVSYPDTPQLWDEWIISRRQSRAILDPFLPFAFCLEDECSEEHEIVSVATLFLTNRECPWKCLMCDLWKNTLTETVPLGAIPGQIDYALARLGPARQIKLYNSGSFFDPRAIPIGDYPEIARRLEPFERVIVESHPALLGDNALRLRDLLYGRLEVAMGLETVHPETLLRLNKRMTIGQFAAGAEWLNRHRVDLRTFILVKPPFMNESQALHWAERSLEFAFACGTSVASLIPTRAGNGALDELALHGEFSPPVMNTIEAAAAYGLSLKRGRVFVDLWDLTRVFTCTSCFPQRKDRLLKMNLNQSLQLPIVCAECQ